MKNIHNLITLLIASSLFLGSVTANATPSVSLNVLDPFITVGETFSVEVNVHNSSIGEELIGYAFNVDPALTLSLLTYNGFVSGPLWGPPPGFGTGSLVIDTALFGITDNDVLLATLSFTATGVGMDTLDVEGLINAFDGLFYEVNEFDIQASQPITINPSSVPDSASLWMAALTLTGLCAWRMGLRKPTR